MPATKICINRLKTIFLGLKYALSSKITAVLRSVLWLITLLCVPFYLCVNVPQMLQYCPTEVVLMSRTLLSGGVVDERNQTPKQAARPHGYYAIRSLFIKIMCNFACLDIITENNGTN